MDPPLRVLQFAAALVLVFALAVGVGRPDVYPAWLIALLVTAMAASIWILERARRGR